MMDYKNINEIIATFNLLIYDEDPKNVRGSLIYYPDGEYRQEVFDTKWLRLDIFSFGIFGGKNA